MAVCEAPRFGRIDIGIGQPARLLLTE
jgi:hypothetical protein